MGLAIIDLMPVAKNGSEMIGRAILRCPQRADRFIGFGDHGLYFGEMEREAERPIRPEIDQGHQAVPTREYNPLGLPSIEKPERDRFLRHNR